MPASDARHRQRRQERGILSCRCGDHRLDAVGGMHLLVQNYAQIQERFGPRHRDFTIGFLRCLLMHQFHPISSPFGVPLKHFSTPLDSDGSFGLCAACIRFVSFLVAREPSVLPAPDQCIAISGLPYSENDACPKKCCPGTPGVPAKSPLFFNRLRGRQACIRWIVSSSIKPYLETGKGYILSN